MATTATTGDSSFEQLVAAFSQRVADLKNIALLRVQGVQRGPSGVA